MRPTRKKVLSFWLFRTKWQNLYNFIVFVTYISLSLFCFAFSFPLLYAMDVFFCLGCCCCYYCLSFRYSVDIQILFIWIIIILSSQRCHNQTLFHMACTVCFARTTKSDIISNQQTLPPHICIYRRTLLRNCVFFDSPNKSNATHLLYIKQKRKRRTQQRSRGIRYTRTYNAIKPMRHQMKK